MVMSAAPKMTKVETRYWDCREKGNQDFADGVGYNNCPFGNMIDEDAWRTGWRESEDEQRNDN